MIQTKLNLGIDIGLFLLFYTILFLPKIGMFDLKALALFLVLLFHITKSRNLKLIEAKEIIVLIISLAFLEVLFLVNAFLNINAYYLIFFRYIRALLSVITLCVYFRNSNVDTYTFLRTFLFAMGFHIAAILISMAFPQIKPFLYMINSYSAKELPLRSPGLVSGYDIAGFYLNITFAIHMLYNLKFENKPFTLYTLFLIAATVFTSRINIMVLIIQIVFSVLYLLSKGKVSVVFSIIFFLPILVFGSTIAILTIEEFIDIRNDLIYRFEWIRMLAGVIRQSYGNPSFAGVTDSQFMIEPQINWLIGNGLKAPSDPGIVNTIYEGGLLALAIKYSCFFFLIYSFMRMKHVSSLALIGAYIAVMTLAYDFKLIFCFATGVFEILLMFLLMTLNEKRVYRKQKLIF